MVSYTITLLCYVYSFSGVDITYVMELMHFSKKYVEVVKKSDVGNWALAYLLYKIFTPLRYTITIGNLIKIYILDLRLRKMNNNIFIHDI